MKKHGAVNKTSARLMKGYKLQWTKKRRRCAALLAVAYILYLLHRVWYVPCFTTRRFYVSSEPTPISNNFQTPHVFSLFRALYLAASALSTRVAQTPLIPTHQLHEAREKDPEIDADFHADDDDGGDDETHGDHLDALEDVPEVDEIFAFAEDELVDLVLKALSADGYRRLALQHSRQVSAGRSVMNEEPYRKMENVLTRRGRELREHGGKRSMIAVIVGQNGMIARDGATYKKAFGSYGFHVETAAERNPSVASGRIEGNLRSVRRLDWDVALCLSLKTAKCITKIEFARTEANAFKKVNRIAGLKTVLWSKDGFCRSLRKSTASWLGIFTFPCWTLPKGYADLAAYSRKSPDSAAFIVKPYSQGGGKGIFVVDAKEVAGTPVLRSARFVVQPYLKRPHLLESKKWDLRTYVVITSLFPLRAYIHSRGLVRLSTTAYDPHAKAGGNKSQYLTNTSINRKFAGSMNDITWSFEKLRAHFGDKVFALFFQRIQASVAFTLLSSLQAFNEHYAGYSPWSSDAEHDFRCSNCYQLLGVDLIADESLHPRVIEVNGEPSMKLTGNEDGHYDQTKLKMQRDLVKLVFAKPHANLVETVKDDISKIRLSRPMEYYSELLNKDKRMVQYLLETKKENDHMGEFRRIFPPSTACVAESHRLLWDRVLSEDSIVRGLGGPATVEVLRSLECLRVERCLQDQEVVNCSLDLQELNKQLLFE